MPPHCLHDEGADAVLPRELAEGVQHGLDEVHGIVHVEVLDVDEQAHEGVAFHVEVVEVLAGDDESFGGGVGDLDDAVEAGAEGHEER